jgi:hypothetical protein
VRIEFTAFFIDKDFSFYEPGAEVVLAKAYMAQNDFEQAEGFAKSAYEKAVGMRYRWGPGNIDADPCFVKPGYWDVVLLQLPDKASDPYPFDGQESVVLDTYLYWTSGFGATSHDVYFGTSNPPLFMGNQISTIFDPPTLLVYNTVYYWRIDEINISGKTIGDVWSFTTGSLADKASNPNPANYATNVDLNAVLIWTAGSGAASHDVYFGTSNPPAFIGNQIYTIFDPGTMDYYTTYFWRIDELNTVGIATGDIWRFTTRAKPPPPPPPPPAPPAEIVAGTDDVVQYIWIDGDYHLLSDSPCIDFGDPDYIPGPAETDLDGKPRVIGGRIDMGAYEYVSPRPVAEAGPDQVVECACHTEEGTKVTLYGSGSYDMGNNPLNFTWSGPFVQSPVHGAAPTIILEDGCPGEYVITLVVNNGIEDSEPNEVVITVVDTTPPEFSLTVSPAVLWPPNHKMVEITPSWNVSDDCDATPQVSIVGIVMSEGNDTIGVGHTSDDIQIGNYGSFYLRAERSGAGNDRVYTITYQAVDDSGNTTLRSATVSIPHDFKVLAGIAAKWLWIKQAGRIPEDLNGDGVVNFTDFARFAENWIK